jgi:hypothetical protein
MRHIRVNVKGPDLFDFVGTAMRKTYLEKRFSCKRGKIADILLKLGYTQEKGDFFKRTSRGRLHIKLGSVTKNRCKMVVHHDLIAEVHHYTVVFDPAPHKAWKQIENKLISIYGTSFEL